MTVVVGFAIQNLSSHEMMTSMTAVHGTRVQSVLKIEKKGAFHCPF